MYRSKKIILVSHCMLNYNSKVERSSVGPNVNNEIIRRLLDADIGIMQLPCPELCHLGIKRWGHVREQLDVPPFKKHCQALFEPYIDQLKDYQNNGYEISGLIGINGSPSCGVEKSCTGSWGGEFGDMDVLKNTVDTAKLNDCKGVFIEVIDNMLRSSNMPLNIIGIDECDQAFSIEQLDIILKGEKR